MTENKCKSLKEKKSLNLNPPSTIKTYRSKANINKKWAILKQNNNKLNRYLKNVFD